MSSSQVSTNLLISLGSINPCIGYVAWFVREHWILCTTRSDRRCSCSLKVFIFVFFDPCVPSGVVIQQEEPKEP
ncbi:hypothetical protein O6P43_011331 [Quillaja saponaria]|uniref:Uncharacterized protein n=1 Tax=Quillaja saponaria TaxID=32244 RepID=A0AAD7Q2K6_QUISA|nr:hypothetical protein O6P43_011331 [Quillaja saponaria]